MKRKLSLTIVVLFLGFRLFGQSKDPYVTSGLEMIFSLANIKEDGQNESPILRWSPFVNAEMLLNKDVRKNFGLFTGLTFRNVGYIYGEYKTNTNPQYFYKKKFRSYNLGIPLGFKIGPLDKTHFFTGYEFEFPILYKEKTYDKGDKIDKITGWFSKRELWLQHGFMLGVQFKYGTIIKFKYYLSQFHNQDFIDSSGVQPYLGLNSHVYYISIGSFLFRDKKMYTSKENTKKI